MGIGKLVGGDEPGADGREGVERFAAVPLPAFLDLRCPLADVVANQVAGDVTECFGLRHPLAPLADHERELDLVVDRRVIRRHDHVVVGTIDRRRCFVEEDGFVRDGGVGFLGVVDVVEAHGHELGRPHYGRTDPRLGEPHFG